MTDSEKNFAMSIALAIILIAAAGLLVYAIKVVKMKTEDFA